MHEQELIDRLTEAATGALELFHVYLGERLGLYRALAGAGPLTAAELAAKAGVNQRYAREWLEEQSVAGFIDFDGDGMFSLPAAHAGVLVDRDSVSFLAPLGQAIVGVGTTMPQLVDAFRTGAGVSFDSFGPDTRESISALNRPAFLRLLGQEWFPAVPDLHRRLQSDPPARVADMGCGTGWSSIAIALAYPGVIVDGIDLDRASIQEADRNARAAGLADRVNFAVRDASDPQLAGMYDVVTAFETIHDMAHPAAALRAMRHMARPDAYVVVMDEKVPDEFSAPGTDLDRFHYGWSAVHCLAAAMGEPDTAATGTIMRTDTLRRYARQAGFTDVEILPVAHDSWRFYRLIG